jgi:hypothetical protein
LTRDGIDTLWLGWKSGTFGLPAMPEQSVIGLPHSVEKTTHKSNCRLFKTLKFGRRSVSANK